MTDYSRYQYAPLPDDLAAKLRAMADVARTVNGGTPEDAPSRAVSVEFSALLAKLHGDGVTYRALAEAAGVTKAAIRLRLSRHGHKATWPSVAPYKGQKIGGSRNEVCAHGHDKNVVGRYRNGGCKKCGSDRSKQSYKRLKEARASASAREGLRGTR